ncbi:MAG: hypothetical protein KF787_11830 [Phycisphaeraceae bacterium]|nr:hypothetical protein [Phycisphaerae bacterium]MBX3393324.1 hypothetical protein [Phycisphaeraceae bacterium]HRJ49206.1 hypothetical protein [Phycisphaerales bacterium]
MSKVDVQTEMENTRQKCWDYTVLVRHDSGDTTQHRVRLSWADHEHWSGGRIPPSRVVETVIDHLIAHGVDTTLPPRFDAGKARRWIPGIDRELRSAL